MIFGFFGRLRVGFSVFVDFVFLIDFDRCSVCFGKGGK